MNIKTINDLKVLTFIISVTVAFCLGFSFAFFLRSIVIQRREKKGKLAVEYTKMPLTCKMKSMVREIIFRYSIQRFNRDFLMNIKLNENTIMQVMHRAHFPEVCLNMADIKFGLAIYIPTKPLTFKQKEKLRLVLEEDSEQFNNSEYPVGYVVIDAGSRVRFTDYLLARLVKEVFTADDVTLELYDDGILPYHYGTTFVKGIRK